jgi:hypothetical protein
VAYTEAVEEPEKASETKAAPIDLLPLVHAEMQRAIGFEQDADLTADRERALSYYKGDVSKDIPTLPNRSKAVSSDVSDAIETLLPDLIEIFIGGDDVVAFIPQTAEDVEAAAQETAYLHHVAFQENPGFLNLNTAIKDALLLKVGVVSWDWKEDIEDQEHQFTGKNIVELQLAAQDGEVSNVKPETEGVDLRNGEQTYSFTLTKTRDCSKAEWWCVAADDFAASADTVNIADATYTCERQRPRVQDLIAQGFDADKVLALPPYAFGDDQEIQQARDTAGESDTGVDNNTDPNLRQVEIRRHCIRVLGKENKLELHCIYTDAEATVEIHREEINEIPYAVGSPYLVPHRLIGRSVADLLIEVMKIKTALYRMVLDSGYFALNQRSEIAMDRANDFTISDLLRNEPMAPVRSKSGDAVRPLVAGPLNFDPYKAIEFFSTVAESRTGVVRNAQGLNPDTLHDTAKGAMMLLSAAQKRTRMIARVLAETLIKPLFLGLHACIRENSQAERQARLLGKWVPVSPSRWSTRNAMTVEVGLGAAGKEAEIAAINQILGLIKGIGQVQGGMSGPLVTWKNAHKASTDMAKKMGVKAPEEYFTDPDSPESQQMMAQKAQQPNPEMMKVQAETQAKQAQMQMDGQMKAQQMQQEGAIKTQQAQAEAQMQMQRQQAEMEIKRYQIDQELTLKREQLGAELQLKREQLQAELMLKREMGMAQMATDATVTSSVEMGGDPG